MGDADGERHRFPHHWFLRHHYRTRRAPTDGHPSQAVCHGGHLWGVHNLLIIQLTDAELGARRRVALCGCEYRRIRDCLPYCRLAWAHGGAQFQCHEMGVIMQVPKDAVLLRIFFGEDEKAGRLPLYEAIVLKAREMHLAGATVLRGPMGFGHSSRIRTTKILRLSQDLPIVIEIVDSEEKINGF